MKPKKNPIEIKVRGYHLDLYQHVNNARYLEFLEEARWAYFESALSNDTLSKMNLAFVIANIHIHYRFPAYLHDVLRIETSEKEIGNRKVVMHQRITNAANDKLIVEADVTFVLVNTTTGRSVELTDDIKTALDL